jgi:hypothetical protein
LESVHEQRLAEYIHEAVGPLSFKRVDPTPALEGVPVVAAWKYKTLNMNRGIALVSLNGTEGHPGEFARAIKKSVGKALGYLPFLYEIGLQLVLVGRETLIRAAGLHQVLDTVNTGDVLLQSLHLVDTDARDVVRDPSAPAPGLQEDLGLPGWAQALEKLQGVTPSGMLMKAVSLRQPAGFERMKARLNYSPETGRAAISVRTWAQWKTGPFIDAIEKGIDQFLAEGDERGR